MEKRKLTYYLENSGDFSAFEKGVASIKGVVFACVDKNACVLSYEIDEWASDYDVFSEVMRLADEAGCVIDFEKTDKAAEQASNMQNAADESLKNAENGENADDNSVGENSEIVKNSEADYGLEENDETDYDDDKKSTVKKHKRSVPEFVQSAICLGVGLICLILGHFLSGNSAKTIMFALAFALSGYELIYSVACDVAAKRILTPKLIALCGVVAALFLGYAEQSVAATLMIAALDLAYSGVKKLVLKNTPVSDANETVGVILQDGGKNREKEMPLHSIKAESVLHYSKGEKCRFEAVLVSPFSTVLRTDGAKSAEIEIKKGDEVKKGDVFLSSSQVEVKKGYRDELNEFENELLSRVLEKSHVSEKFENKRVVICASILGVLLLIAFIPPVFYGSYLSGLYRWGYFSVIASVLLYGACLTFSNVAEISALACGFKSGIMPFGVNLCLNAADCKTVSLDKESALDDQNGTLKADCAGAVRELKDYGKKIALLTLLEDEKAAELCKELKIHEYYSFNSEQEKQEKIKLLAAENVQCVSCFAEADCVTEFSAEKTYKKGAAMIPNGEIAFVPYAYRLAARAKKAKKASFILSAIAKLALLTLSAFGLASLWWVALADTVVCLICLAICFAVGREVY